MMNKNFSVAVLAMAVLGACSNVGPDKNVAEIDNLTKERDALSSSSRYYVSDLPYAKKTPVRANNFGEQWLQSKQFGLAKQFTSSAVPLAEIIKAFSASGINIVSTLPIEGLHYYGPPISSATTADSALQLLTEQMGLDYEVVHRAGSTPFVRITEMGNLTFRLRVPDVVTSLSMSSPLTLSQAGDQSQSGTNLSSNNGSVGAMQSPNQGGAQRQSAGGNQNGGSSTSYQTAFWEKLEAELKDMMKIVGPAEQQRPTQPSPSFNDPYSGNAMVQPYQMGMGMPHMPNINPLNATGPTNEKTVGRVVVNSLTGNISVTAPRHIRERISKYLKDIDDELNTRISVKTRIVSVTRSADESRGIDIAGFKNFANDKYGFAVTNNVLGEITISDISDGVRRASATDAISQSILGVTRADKAFEAFFAYLQSTGSAQSVSNLSGTANSGRTVFLRRAGNDPVLRNSTTQITTDGGNTIGGSNSTVEQNYTGTSMKITPVYNTRRGIVNALIDIEMVLDAGEKAQTEQIVSGNTIKPNTIFLKKLDSVNIQTMSVARLGETIVVGNFTTLRQVDNASGVTGLRSSIVGDLFGKSSTRTVMTDYFVLLSVEAHRYSVE